MKLRALDMVCPRCSARPGHPCADWVGSHEERYAEAEKYQKKLDKWQGKHVNGKRSGKRSD